MNLEELKQHWIIYPIYHDQVLPDTFSISRNLISGQITLWLNRKAFDCEKSLGDQLLTVWDYEDERWVDFVDTYTYNFR